MVSAIIFGKSRISLNYMQFSLIFPIAVGRIEKYLRIWYFVGIYQSAITATRRGFRMIGSQTLRLERQPSLPNHAMAAGASR